MKKLILLATVLFGMNTLASAQDVDEIKNFRFGLKGDLSLNWLTPGIDDKSTLKNEGAKIGYSWGLQLEFKLNKTISIATGLNLSTMSYALDYNVDPNLGGVYYVLDSKNTFEDLSSNTDGSYDSTKFRYNMQNRSFKANYVNIPFLLKMKTNEIGYLTYFGEFGANINILVKSTVKKDQGIQEIDGASYVKEDLNITKSTGLMNLGIKIGGGAEYNFSGSTSIFFGLHYNHYFLNAFRGKEKYMQQVNVNNPSEFEAASKKATPGAVTLTVGILF